VQSFVGVFQIDAQVVAQVVAARRARSSSAGPGATEVAEQVIEDVRKGRCKIALVHIATATGTADAHAALEGRMAIAVIGCLFLGVLEHFIGFVRLFELRFRLRVVGVAVGVKLFRLLAVGFLDRVGVGPFGHTENVVKIAFCHVSRSPLGSERPARFNGPV